MTVIKNIEAEVKQYYEGLDIVHDWKHIQRVRKFALELGRHEKADLKILEIAALLHDIGRKYSNDEEHAQKSYEMAREILEKYDLSKEEKENILDCVLSHSLKSKKEPKTKEGIVLRDADKLDLAGIVGIARILMFYAARGDSFEKLMEEYKYKLLICLKKDVKTEYAKKIIEKDFSLIERFYKELKEKW